MRTFIFLTLALLTTTSKAQQLAPDQNPNYMVSQQRYIAMKDSLLLTMNTTIHNTYKAYDWYEDKLERRRTRVENRNQRRLARIHFNNMFNQNNAWNNFGYHDWRFRRMWPNNIGYNTGNWWFWF